MDRWTRVAVVVALAVLGLVGAVLGPLGLASAQTATPTVVRDNDVYAYPLGVQTLSVTFANTTSVSGAADVYGQRLVGLVTPASWVTASITLQGSTDCATYGNVREVDGTEYEIVTVPPSTFVTVPDGELTGFRCVRLRSGTAVTATDQTGGAKSVTVVVRR